MLQVRVKKMIAQLESEGFNIQVTQALRSYEEQQAFWNLGRDAQGNVVDSTKIVTKAPPGYSWHNFGLAVDLCPIEILLGSKKLQADWNTSHTNWQRMIAVGLECELGEGAQFRDFPDWPHFYPQELPANPPDVVRALYSVRGLVAVSEWYETLLAPAAPASANDRI